MILKFVVCYETYFLLQEQSMIPCQLIVTVDRFCLWYLVLVVFQTATQLEKYTSFERATGIINVVTGSTLQSIQGYRQRSACESVRKCFDSSICDNFKNYFEKIEHSKNTRNNKASVRTSKLSLESNHAGSWLRKSIMNFPSTSEMSRRIQNL